MMTILMMPTVPGLVRSKFAYTRAILVGEKIKTPLLPKIMRPILSVIGAVSLMLAVILLAPDLYYLFTPVDTQPVEALTLGTPLGGEFDQGSQSKVIAAPLPVALPPQNPNLPSGEWLVIPRIGVRTQLQVTTDPSAALEKGVWLVPNYGQPGENELPIIMAAHRYGWQWWWQSDYWKYNSFYNLPELEPGDLVEVIADQRKWVYEVYAGEEGDEISDYDADLILYTCKFLNSPVRHFRYARLIDLNQDTQVSQF